MQIVDSEMYLNPNRLKRESSSASIPFLHNDEEKTLMKSFSQQLYRICIICVDLI